MNKTWIFISLFANACILVHSYRDGIPEFLKHLENTNGVNARRVYFDYMDHPTRKSKIKDVTPYARLFKPGQSHEEIPTLDPPVNPQKYLPKAPTKPFESLNLNLNEALLPETSFGKIPGPGSENLYPNGIRITYNNPPSANSRGPVAGETPTGFYPNPPDIPGLSYGNENTINKKINHALRMGGQDQSMAGGPPSGYMEQGEPPWMGNSPPPGNMQGEVLPGMGNVPPPEYKQGGASPVMGAGLPPNYMQGSLPGAVAQPRYMQKELPPGLGGGPLPVYMQRGPPSVMDDGPPQEYMQGAIVPEMDRGSMQGYMQGGPYQGLKGPPLENVERPKPTGWRNGFPTWLPQKTEWDLTAK